MLAVVAHVQACEETFLRATAARWKNAPAARLLRTDFVVHPKDAELAQFLGAERFRGARVAPVHVPGVFREDHAHVLLLHLLGKHALVKVPELLLNAVSYTHLTLPTSDL